MARALYHTNSKTDLGILSKVFFAFGIISILTSFFFSAGTKEGYQAKLSPNEIWGPIQVNKKNASYKVKIQANLGRQSWSFLEIEVLDSEKEYLYSFGKELWRESGRDSEGAWQENNTSYKMNITFAKTGNYYFRLKSDSNRAMGPVHVLISRVRGSGIPHLIFGIICIIVGVVFHEKKHNSLARALEGTYE
ncbi:MAG: hypothetical protein HON23_00980 [Rickettsiales bacterium]|jgi:hypothetical protein|nr:hypothetical protein [Rickettsiales bacterium]